MHEFLYFVMRYHCIALDGFEFLDSTDFSVSTTQVAEIVAPT